MQPETLIAQMAVPPRSLAHSTMLVERTSTKTPIRLQKSFDADEKSNALDTVSRDKDKKAQQID